jgi:hypothetical protein
MSCTYGSYSAWSRCSHECVPANGEIPYQWRMRPVIDRQPGAECGETYESRPCENLPACVSQDCVEGPWSEFGPCSIDGGTVNCGHGTTFRYRSIVTAPSGLGARPCGALVDFRECRRLSGSTGCSVGCTTGAWSEWSACDRTCGGGTQRRTRTVTPGTFGTQPDCYDRAANTHDYEERDCNTHSCGTDCVLGEWEPVGTCSASCGGGQQLFIRRRISEGTGTGTRCPSETSFQRMRYDLCNAQPCAPAEEKKETEVEVPPSDDVTPPQDQQEPPTPPQDTNTQTTTTSTTTSTTTTTTPSAAATPIPVPVIFGVLGGMLVIAIGLLLVDSRRTTSMAKKSRGAT